MNVIRPEVIALCQRQEAFRATPYKDKGGRLAIGFGHSIIGPPVVTPDLVWTYEYATHVLMDDLDLAGKHIVSHLDHGITLDDWQYSSLAMFAENIGLNAFDHSSVAQNLRDGHMEMVPISMNMWSKYHDDNGKLVDSNGLKKRRYLEAAFFMHSWWS
jgi:GH24 family phage-related lysozyme (muramidase)